MVVIMWNVGFTKYDPQGGPSLALFGSSLCAHEKQLMLFSHALHKNYHWSSTRASVTCYSPVQCYSVYFCALI